MKSGWLTIKAIFALTLFFAGCSSSGSSAEENEGNENSEVISSDSKIPDLDEKKPSV